MLLGCYFSGYIPLAFSLSEEKLRIVSVFGSGLLVGAALAVIIPEGVHMLYDSKAAAEASHAKEIVSDAQKEAEGHHDHSHGELADIHLWIGMSLVLGFVFMLLIDQIGSGGHSHNSSGQDSEPVSNSSHRHRITATVGLVVHAAADGIALGAAASTSQMHIEMIVFIAIMLHKAPAAFGLVSFLLHEGFDKRSIKRHLFAFALAAPIGAVVTFFGLTQHSKDALSTVNGTGIAMVFSGGTFLYVATVHILPEITKLGATRTTLSDGSVVIHEHKGLSRLEVFVMVIGCLFPLLLSLSHSH